MPRFRGHLQTDLSVEDVLVTAAMVEAGEGARLDRCERVWLGTSDLEEEVEYQTLLNKCLTLRVFGDTRRLAKYWTWDFSGAQDRSKAPLKEALAPL